ncbi:MAG TPA: hypothetical protein VMM12_00125 [Longimicrobiales bacterium]|nr:hypothetical protein [Longimicrobiales bacterium]
MPGLWPRFLDGLRGTVLAPLARRWAADDAAMGPSSLVRAGDIAREAGQRQEALGLWGRAIDAYLQRGLHHQAETVCRRVIGMEPNVIRTRFTLAAIAVGRRRVREGRERVADYLAAAARAEATAMAVPSLLELASATADPAMRRILADALRQAGREDLGDRVDRGTAAVARRTSWRRAVGAALKRPGDVDVAALSGP